MLKKNAVSNNAHTVTHLPQNTHQYIYIGKFVCVFLAAAEGIVFIDVPFKTDEIQHSSNI